MIYTVIILSIYISMFSFTLEIWFALKFGIRGGRKI